MRRVIAFCRWKAFWWLDQVDRRQAVEVALKDGLRAFALEHAASETRFANYLETRWEAVRKRASLALLGEGDNEAEVGALLEIKIDYHEEGDAIGYVNGFLTSCPLLMRLFWCVM